MLGGTKSIINKKPLLSIVTVFYLYNNSKAVRLTTNPKLMFASRKKLITICFVRQSLSYFSLLYTDFGSGLRLYVEAIALPYAPAERSTIKSPRLVSGRVRSFAKRSVDSHTPPAM